LQEQQNRRHPPPASAEASRTTAVLPISLLLGKLGWWKPYDCRQQASLGPETCVTASLSRLPQRSQTNTSRHMVFLIHSGQFALSSLRNSHALYGMPGEHLIGPCEDALRCLRALGPRLTQSGTGAGLPVLVPVPVEVAG
jgi:hypothetical protein